MRFYEVAFTSIIRKDSDVLTYHSETAVPIGSLVTAPVGKKQLAGIVCREVARPAYETKPLGELIEHTPIPQPLLQTATWMSQYYSTHLAIVLQTLLPAGLTKKRRAAAANHNFPKRERTQFLLNEEQIEAVQKITNSDQKTVLLHGVTGAGKTAVYIEVARQTIREGKSVIILTPEISLTPQLVAEFQNHFERVVFTHSQLSEAERHLQWRTVLCANEPQIIIGPRSALFLPAQKIGAIIIDECHEPSYKQEQQPRYTTSRVARILATKHHARLVLGSATPSVSDYFLASSQGIVATLTKRAKEFSPPKITLIDASKRNQFSRSQVFSTQLIKSIADQLAQKKQILLFHNRRGSASSILCEKCGWHAACEDCLLPLTLHTDIYKLQCHVCGKKSRIPANCPVCKHADIIFKGIGTKGLEAEVRRLFPKARIGRFDADSEKGEKLHDQYQAVYDGDIDIIIGTQLIAKGLDLPKLGLAAIVQADTGLLLPDFQARERAFQLISQACGRVGRQDHTTEVIVQTFYPEKSVVAQAIHEQYEAFFEDEIKERKRAHYPPFIHLLTLVCVYKTEASAVRASRELTASLRQNHPNVEIIGPTPAFYERLRGSYRWQITIKSTQRTALQAIAATIPPKWQIELDPHSLLH